MVTVIFYYHLLLAIPLLLMGFQARFYHLTHPVHLGWGTICICGVAAPGDVATRRVETKTSLQNGMGKIVQWRIFLFKQYIYVQIWYWTVRTLLLRILCNRFFLVFVRCEYLHPCNILVTRPCNQGSATKMTLPSIQLSSQDLCQSPPQSTRWYARWSSCHIQRCPGTRQMWNFVAVYIGTDMTLPMCRNRSISRAAHKWAWILWMCLYWSYWLGSC